MIPFTTIKAEIAAVMLAISGLPAAQVYWRDEAKGSTWIADPMVSMRISSISRLGIEEEIREDNTPPADQTVTMVGHRLFMLSLRAESFEQDIGSVNFAGNVLDRIAIRLQRSTTLAQITSFAVATRQPTQWFAYRSDGRQMSCYVLDIQCAAVDTDIDDTASAGDFINEVIGSGTVDAITVDFEAQGS